MATKLKKMRLTSVDLVRAGANQEADICLYKSADPPEATESPADAETGIFKRFLNWLRENPAEDENEPQSPVEKADDQPDLEYIYKSALAESLQSIMADDTLTEIEKKDMTEESLRQYAEKIQELERMDEEEDRLEEDYEDDIDDDDDDTMEEEIIEEVVRSRKSDDGFYDYIEESQIRKYNHNHGADGKFSGSPGAGGGGSRAAVNGSGTMSPKELAAKESRRDELWNKEDHGKITAKEKKELKDLESSISAHYDEKKRSSTGSRKKPAEMSHKELEQAFFAAKDKRKAALSNYSLSDSEKAAVEREYDEMDAEVYRRAESRGGNVEFDHSKRKIEFF